VLSGDVNADQIPFEPPVMPPPSRVDRFFTAQEASLLDALTARILPGSTDDPGAREAGTVNFIDNMLAEYQAFDEPTYFHAPFVGVESDKAQLPEGVSELTDDELDRYGFQGSQTPQEFYRAGLASLAAFAMESQGIAFDQASEDQQDVVVKALSDGSASAFDTPKAKDFFKRVRSDTIHAVFSDPLYGGNQDFAGWRLIGYLGAQRGWLPVELIEGPNPARNYKGLQHLHPTNPGRPSPPAIEPVQMPDPRVR
jgi:gluconate 2-dehydrogenase gamma chain